jgi:hypothetical protein
LLAQRVQGSHLKFISSSRPIIINALDLALFANHDNTCTLKLLIANCTMGHDRYAQQSLGTLHARIKQVCSWLTLSSLTR